MCWSAPCTAGANCLFGTSTSSAARRFWPVSMRARSIPWSGSSPILPDRVAWIATEVILFSLIAVGMYLFLRALKTVDDRLRAGGRRVFVLRRRPEPGQPCRHDRGIRLPPLHVAGRPCTSCGTGAGAGPSFSVSRSHCHLRWGPRGDAGRGVLGHRLCRPLRRVRSPELVAGADPLWRRARRWHFPFPPCSGCRALPPSRTPSVRALGPSFAGSGSFPPANSLLVAGALPLRRLRPPRRGEVLLALQPARGRHLRRDPSDHRPASRSGVRVAVAPGFPRAPDVVHHRSARPPVSPSGPTPLSSTSSTRSRSTAASVCRAGT